MPIESITTKPWEPDDPERIAKFVKGIPGETSDIWTAKPNLDPCWRGNHRHWNIHHAPTYQSQLYCRYWETFINPSGFSCAICKAAPDDNTPPGEGYFPGQPQRLPPVK